MKKRKVAKDRPIVIGFDETNNGFGLKCHNPHHKASMIVTGYLGDLTRISKDYQGQRYGGKKGGLFNDSYPIKEALNRSREFLSNNPAFFYVSVPRYAFTHTPDEIVRARAMALLTIKFFIKYRLDPKEIQIVSDQISGKEQSDLISDVFRLFMKKARLKVPFTYIQHAEHNYLTTRMADRISYYITAIHFIGDNRKWPHRSRRVSYEDLESLTLDITGMKD